tara:strand:- start:111 stop:809 length:699 start_codon:yes stop_codon:yes gene_type:complete
MLSNYLAYLKYDITSIEPGGFRKEIDSVRRKILKFKEPNLKIKNNYLENISNEYQNKIDFAYSINVLEHTKNIKKHLSSVNQILKDEKSICHIRCPNYSFPFESHFYVFFIPTLPLFTFKILHEKKLIKKYGKRLYFSTLNSLNFGCTYFKVKNLNQNLFFLNTLDDIFLRIEKDKVFKKRILSNKIISFTYSLIKNFGLKKLISFIYPNLLSPYMVMNLKKNCENVFRNKK